MENDAAIHGRVRAYVVLKRPADASATGRVQPPSPELREQARRQLEMLGFRVLRVSPLSILIEGPAAKFESIFHSEARLRKTIPSKSWPETHLSWRKDPEIPAPLNKIVADLVLPEPVELH
jgi:hypothetical protein